MLVGPLSPQPVQFSSLLHSKKRIYFIKWLESFKFRQHFPRLEKSASYKKIFISSLRCTVNERNVKDALYSFWTPILDNYLLFGLPHPVVSLPCAGQTLLNTDAEGNGQIRWIFWIHSLILQQLFAPETLISVGRIDVYIVFDRTKQIQVIEDFDVSLQLLSLFPGQVHQCWVTNQHLLVFCYSYRGKWKSRIRWQCQKTCHD